LKKRNVSIIGLGLIGGSIAKAMKNTDKSFAVSAFDKPGILDLAIKQKVIDNKLNSPEEAKDSDIIFICLPADSSLEVIENLAPIVKKGTIISDTCSVKGIFEKKWRLLLSDGTYIGGHPMAGKEEGGYQNSDPLLFENSVYILSDAARNNPRLSDFISVIENFGARVKLLNPFVHDKIVARVSHLPQLMAVALVNSAADNEEDINYLDYAAGGFRDMTRIASSDYYIWDPVIKTNKKEIIASLEKIQKTLNAVKHSIHNKLYEDLRKLFENARQKRDEIPKNTKGFIKPLFDVFVYCEDEPGVLSQMTTALYKNSINIKDIELLKIREGEGGTFRIAFENQDDSEKAKSLLEEIGFVIK